MRTISTNHFNNVNVLELINHCKETQVITKQRYKELMVNVKELSKDLVNLFNHKKSSSISFENYKMVMDTISYYVNHGINSEKDLIDTKLVAIYERGVDIVSKDIEELKEIYHQLVLNRLNVSNDRYNSILDEQYPNYFKSLNEYRSIFNHTIAKEDLDYPLFDGMSMDHNMYDSTGSDLYLYYLKRFKIENDFCRIFKEDFCQLIKEFEIQHDVENKFLNINFCDLCTNQFIANSVINRNGILLSENDYEYFSKMDRKQVLEIIAKNYNNLSNILPKEIAQYLNLFKEQTIMGFNNFYDHNFDFLVYEQKTKEQFNITLLETSENQLFLRNLCNLQLLNNTEEKVNYIHEKEVNLFDLLDLFDHDIFDEEEFIEYFNSCSSLELSLLIKQLNPSVGKFNEVVKIDDNLFSDFSDEYSWVFYFIEFLKELDGLRRKELEELLNKIKIN
ncbi:DUF6179 domain-containing protein [Anaerorhabdus sp.]|uniref:DUF6179 domain-containing protein n=1 Tax=Anaerorhabdus sp. TaxID=1872524 RepID=UPI002FCAE960